MEEIREIPPEIQQRYDTWFRLHKRWSYIHYILGIAAVVFSTIAAALAPFELTWAQIPLSIIAAACAGLITFMQPAIRAETLLRAWSVLDKALTKYKYDSEYPRQRLIAAKEKGQEIVQNKDGD